MPDLADAFAAPQQTSGVSIIYGTALADSDSGDVTIQLGEAITAIPFDNEDEQEETLVEMDDLMDSNGDEDYEAEQPYESDEEGAEPDPEDVIADDETDITDSEDENDQDVPPEPDEGDELTETGED